MSQMAGFRSLPRSFIRSHPALSMYHPVMVANALLNLVVTFPSGSGSKGGRCQLTTHRLIWISESRPGRCCALRLEGIKGLRIKTKFVGSPSLYIHVALDSGRVPVPRESFPARAPPLPSLSADPFFRYPRRW